MEGEVKGQNWIYALPGGCVSLRRPGAPERGKRREKKEGVFVGGKKGKKEMAGSVRPSICYSEERRSGGAALERGSVGGLGAGRAGIEKKRKERKGEELLSASGKWQCNAM